MSKSGNSVLDTGVYSDIINTKWDNESLKNRMPVSQRAKIFLPFAALTGYEDELDKTLQLEIESMKQRTGSIKFYETEEQTGLPD